ncbi:hypothetical protein [Halorientalis halophila]|uniref:hypothetical protein n=1 Tax=Halorientalis halophila TaxID=3108499 RepID=UPI0030099E69
MHDLTGVQRDRRAVLAGPAGPIGPDGDGARRGRSADGHGAGDCGGGVGPAIDGTTGTGG